MKNLLISTKSLDLFGGWATQGSVRGAAGVVAPGIKFCFELYHYSFERTPVVTPEVESARLYALFGKARGFGPRQSKAYLGPRRLLEIGLHLRKLLTCSITSSQPARYLFWWSVSAVVSVPHLSV